MRNKSKTKNKSKVKGWKQRTTNKEIQGLNKQRTRHLQVKQMVIKNGGKRTRTGSQDT